MRLRLFICLLVLFPSALLADDWAALKQPGAVALMRHALAPGTGDPAAFQLGDCATQRNLNAQGRDQAQRVGVALRDAGITFDHVWSSGWCRAYDTAVLMDLGQVAVRPFLHSFFAGRGDGASQTQATRDALAAVPLHDTVLIVSHQVNITALTGVFPASGEIIIARRLQDGMLEVSGRVAVAP